MCVPAPPLLIGVRARRCARSGAGLLLTSVFEPVLSVCLCVPAPLDVFLPYSYGLIPVHIHEREREREYGLIPVLNHDRARLSAPQNKWPRPGETSTRISVRLVRPRATEHRRALCGSSSRSSTRISRKSRPSNLLWRPRLYRFHQHQCLCPLRSPCP